MSNTLRRDLLRHLWALPAEDRVVERLIARKRERATLEALQDLVRYLQAIREERKAIITVSEGWLLYRDDPGAREAPQKGSAVSVS